MASKKNYLGKYLAEKRKNKKVTQKAIADAIEVHSQFISNIERDVSPAPAYVLKAYVKLCKISKDEFLREVLKRRESEVREQVFGEKEK